MIVSNSYWVCNPSRPGWALCLDPADQHFGWKMREDPAHGEWVPVVKAAAHEVRRALCMEKCRSHWPQLAILRDWLSLPCVQGDTRGDNEGHESSQM